MRSAPQKDMQTMVQETKINEAFEQNYKGLFGYCMANLDGDEQAAMDAVDTVFMIAGKKADELDKVRDVKLWLMGFAKNTVRNIRRTQKRYKNRFLLFDPISASSEGIAKGTALTWWEKRAYSLMVIEQELPGERRMTEEELGELKEKMLNTLSDEERELFRSRYDDGISTKELAARYGKTQDAVRAKLTRISVKLIDRIKIYFENQRSF